MHNSFMKPGLYYFFILLAVLTSCSLPGGTQAPTPPAASPKPLAVSPSSTPSAAPTDPPPIPTTILRGETLPPFPSSPPGYALDIRPDLHLKTWQPSGLPSAAGYSLPVDLDQVANPAVLGGLTVAQREM